MYNALTDRQTTCLRLARGWSCDAKHEALGAVRSEIPP